MRDRFDEAIRYHSEALELRSSVLGEEHPDTLTSMGNLARTLNRAGNSREALPLFERLVEVAPRNLPDGHPIVGIANLYYGECLTKLERYEEAEAALLEAEIGLTKTFGATSTQTQRARQALAALYDLWGKPVQAEEYRRT